MTSGRAFLAVRLGVAEFTSPAWADSAEWFLGLGAVSSSAVAGGRDRSPAERAQGIFSVEVAASAIPIFPISLAQRAPAILLRESCREGKKILNHTLANLSALSLLQAEACSAICVFLTSWAGKDALSCGLV